MVPVVAPLERVRLMDCGGQVEKKPADELVPATVTLMGVVPG